MKELFVSKAREEDNEQCGHLKTLFDIVFESKVRIITELHI